jgi:pimeloyl-ACP methyl ester carboxylesterase
MRHGPTVNPALSSFADAAVDALPFEGHRLHRLSGGTGPTLWLVHGFPTSSQDWAGVWPALSERFALHAIDMLGFGRSDKPRDFNYCIRASADQWQALAKATGVRELRVLAHDYGNTVVQELLARQREGALDFRITAVVFLNGGLFPEATRPLPIQRLLAGPLGPVVARLSSERRFVASMRHICARPLADDDLHEAWRLIERAQGKQRMPALLGYIRERGLHRQRWLDALQQAGLPLALVNGVEDPISGRAIVARWRELLPGSPVVELPGVGHYPQLESPVAVVSALERMLPR